MTLVKHDKKSWAGSQEVFMLAGELSLNSGKESTKRRAGIK
jgi:hypothetical protein